MTQRSTVAIAKGSPSPDDDEINSLTREAVRLAGGLGDIVARGATIIIKPNLVAPATPDKGATTDRRICKSIADQVKELGGRPIIAESSCIGVDTEDSIRASRYDELRNQGYEVLDLKGCPLVNIAVPHGEVLTELRLPRVVVEADAIISVPKLKTHDQAPATLAIKNMKGILPDVLKKKFHTTFGVFQAVAEFNSVLPPAFSVVDGIIGQEGFGPVFGTPIELDLILAGRDPVAVDTVAGMVMGIAPETMEITKRAAALGVGTMNLDLIDVVGKTISEVRHRFQLESEALADELRFPPRFELIFNDKACTGCRNGVLSTLRDLSDMGQLSKIENLRIVVGNMDSPPPPSPKKQTLLVGTCTSAFKNCGEFVIGCPPNNVDILAAISRASGG